MVLPDHNLLGSWEIDFHQLGYTPEQVVKRLDVGYMWYSMCVFAYMVAVAGGSMLIAVYRLDGKAGTGPDAVHSETPEESLSVRHDAGAGMLRSLLPHPALPMISRR